MNSYATFDDYLPAIGSPKTSFSDPEIAHRLPSRDSMGMPEYFSGGYAITFKFIQPGGQSPIAVRCFKQEIKDLIQRYAAIDDFLKQLQSRFFVDFAISMPSPSRPRAGVFAGNSQQSDRWLPAMRMRWVEGEAIGLKIRKECPKPELY